MNQHFMGGTSDRTRSLIAWGGRERREQKGGRGGREYLRTLESHKLPYGTTPVS